MFNIGNIIMNLYILKIDSGYMIIDTGYEHNFKNCIKKLSEKNISINEIKYIFLTHAHDDHAGFINNMLKMNKNIKVIMSKKGLKNLQLGQNSFEGGCSNKQSYYFCYLLKLLGKGEHLFPAIKTIYLKNLLLIDSENKESIEKDINGTIIETSGHTSDCISFLSNDNNLFCGDATMNGFPSKNNITIWIENIEDYKKSWQKIIDLNPSKIYPAHGKPFDVISLKDNIQKIDNIKLLPLQP